MLTMTVMVKYTRKGAFVKIISFIVTFVILYFRQRLCKHMSSIPLFSNKLKENNKYKILYENSPEVLFNFLIINTPLQVLNRPKVLSKSSPTELFAPGLSSFIKFQQNHKPLLTMQRDIARNILMSTYHTKDFEIASHVSDDNITETTNHNY